RLDTHVEDGYRVPPHYDSLLGKLITLDETRPQAIDRMLRALGELVLDGVPTTRELAIDVLRSDEFSSGRYSTGFLAEAAGPLPELARSVQERVAEALGQVSGLRVERVDVILEEVS